jgi:hypothetical protein
MSIIREPLEVDFFVIPTPPTKEELELISQYIRDFKAKQAKQKKRPSAKASKKSSKK